MKAHGLFLAFAVLKQFLILDYDKQSGCNPRKVEVYEDFYNQR